MPLRIWPPRTCTSSSRKSRAEPAAALAEHEAAPLALLGDEDESISGPEFDADGIDAIDGLEEDFALE